MFIHTANIVRKPKKQKPKTYIRSIKIILPSSLLIIVQKHTLLVQKNPHYSTTSALIYSQLQCRNPFSASMLPENNNLHKSKGHLFRFHADNFQQNASIRNCDFHQSYSDNPMMTKNALPYLPSLYTLLYSNTCSIHTRRQP